MQHEDCYARRALNRGRIYDCGRVPPLPKQKGRRHQQDINGSCCFTLLSFLTSSHTNKRRNAFSKSGWCRRIERGQISIDGIVCRDPDHLLSKAKQHIEYKRFPWKEPVLRVAVSIGNEGEKNKDNHDSESDDDKQALKILYVDDHLLVIHKPSGLPTMPSQTFFEYSVLNALRRLYGERSDHNKNSPQTPTNVVATSNAQQLIQFHCSVEPQPVHRLGVGTSGVLVVAASQLGRQKLTDAIRFKSNNITSIGSSTAIRKIYRALVYARRCDDRPGNSGSNIDEYGFACNRNGPRIPKVFTIDCPIGLVPFPIGGDSIHAACPCDSDSLYRHIHERGPSAKSTTNSTGEYLSSTAEAETEVCSKKSTIKAALSYVRVVCLKNLETREGTTEEVAVVQVEIPTGRPHQIRIHLAYAGYPLVGDPLYIPGGIPNTVPRRFESMEKEEEDMESDDEKDEGEDNAHVSTSKCTNNAKRKFVNRVALPRDCGYYLHAHTITLEHPCAESSSSESDDENAATTRTFTAPPPNILKE